MLDVRRSPELQATLLALKQTDRDIRRDVGKTAKANAKPVWAQELASHASTPLERAALIPSNRVVVSGQRVAVVAGGSRRALSGGLVPDDSKGLEYGSRRFKQFRRPSKGWVVNPAAGAAGHVIVAGWVRDVIAVLRNVGEVS